MSRDEKRKGNGRKITSIVLFVLAGMLLLTAAGGFFLRGTEGTRNALSAMRTQAVLHSASDGLLDAIASKARSDKLKELRARSDFRSLGLEDRVQEFSVSSATVELAAQALGVEGARIAKTLSCIFTPLHAGQGIIVDRISAVFADGLCVN